MTHGAGGEHRRMSKRFFYWLLVVPFAATLVPPLYARREPSLLGFPFFYWYQILWIVLAAAIVWIVYAATREAKHE
jgi:uncharacterized membrane protein YdbT with pleckstrin-like domain